MSNLFTLQDLDAYLSTKFNFALFSRIDTINGIQVTRHNENAHHGHIRKIAYAVDSSLETIERAVALQPDVLLVHHGLYWGTPLPVKDGLYHKIKKLLDANIALYAIHLPLDAHIPLGNNAQIAARLNLTHIEAFGEYKGIEIGVQGTLASAQDIGDLYERFFSQKYYPSDITIDSTKDTIFAPIEVFHTDNKTIKKVAIISGGGTREIQAAYAVGADLYITGDASHTALLEAKELEINVWFSGHYFTEIWGVLAIATHLQETLGIEGVFIEKPTQL